jgi:zinc protease
MPDFHSRFRAGIVGTSLLIGAATLAAAQVPAGNPPPITAGMRESRLSNGMRVLIKKVRTAPVVSFAVWYRVGSRNEQTGITGTSHLLEHMLFKGTRKYRLGEISRTLFVNGATFNAGTYYDTTAYFETLSSDRLELAMEIEADRMVNSRIDAADVASEMSVVRSELEGGENDPRQLLNSAVAAAAFESHPYQWPIIGFRTDVENVPRNAIYDYYRRHYGPNNATAVIIGDVDEARALALVRKHFGKLKPIPAPPTVYTQEPPQRGERRVTIRRAGALPMVQLAFKTPAGKHPDFYALDLLGVALGGGRASRLYQALVEKQLASEVSAGAPTMRDPYLFEFFATARAGVSVDRLEAALRQEIERAKTETFTPAELERAKNQIVSQFVFQADSVSEQASQIGFYDATIHWTYLNSYLDRVRALTAAQVRSVARKYFVDASCTTGQFIPSSAAAPGGPPPRNASARVEKAKQGDRPVALPKPAPLSGAQRQVTRFTLANGLRVVVQENHANATVALTASLPAGSVFDGTSSPGLAQMTAAMLNRGTRKYGSLQFAARLEGVGAELSASAGGLSCSFSGKAQSRDFDLLIELLGEMVRHPTFPTESLERLKGELLAGLEEEKTDPSSVANRAFERAVYPEGNPLRPPTLDALLESVKALSSEQLAEFHRRQFGPAGMILVIAGDVSTARVRKALEAQFGDWPRTAGASSYPAIPVHLQAGPVRSTLQVPDRSEAAILWGHAGLLQRSDPDFYATQALNMILGGGGALNSRLGNVIRDQQGLAYGVFSFFDSDLYPGPFQVSLGTNPANAARAVRSLEEQIRLVREKGVTQRELDETVAYLTGRFPLRLETNAGMAFLLWQMEYYRLGPDYIDRYGSLYRAVSVAQVNAAARKHLRPDRATLVIAGTVPPK